MSYQSLSTIHILFTGCGQHPGEDITLYCKTCGEVRVSYLLSTLFTGCHTCGDNISLLLFTGCGQHPGEDIALYCKTCGEGACDSTCHTNLSLLFIFCSQVVGSIHILFTGCGQERISLSTVRHVERARLHMSYQSLSTIHILFTGCGQHPGEDITLYCKTCGEGACDSTCHTNLSLLFIYCLQVVGSIRERISLSTVRHVGGRVWLHMSYQSLLFIYCSQVVGSIRERISLSTVRRVERARVAPHVIPISLYYS